MKHKQIVLIGLLSLATFSWAEDAATAPDLSATLSDIQIKLEHTAERANQPSAEGSNVIGLRGSKQEPLSKQLYWKGKTGNVPVTPDEVKAFRSAIDEAEAGKKDQASIDLRAFLDKYPKTHLKADAEALLKLLPSAATPLSPPKSGPQSHLM